MKKITRVWHGTTKTEHADQYLKYIKETGLSDYKSIDGNQSVKILRRIDENLCHFLTITEWDSYESILKFAGKDFEKAKYYSEDEKYLLELEENVVHYETFE